MNRQYVIPVTFAALVIGIALMASGCDQVSRYIGPGIAVSHAVSDPTPEKVGAAGVVVTRAVLPPAQEADIRRGCVEGEPLLQAGQKLGVPRVVYETAVYPAEYCRQLLALPPGTVPPTTDAKTPSWFNRVMSVLPDVLRIAGVFVR